MIPAPPRRECSAPQGWVQAMRDVSVLDVARALGFPVSRPSGSSGGSVYGCPACGAERRHPSRRDRRGAIGVRHDGRGWRCFECQVAGDALDLVACRLGGRRLRDLSDADCAQVREWCARYARIECATPRPMRSPASPEQRDPCYPPADEISRLWRAAPAVTADAAARRWLADRRAIDPVVVADRDLARAVPPEVALPRWAARWPASGYRVLLPLVDEQGRRRSVLARRVVASDGAKSLAPKGYSTRGLVLACGLARQVMRLARRPDWWGEDEETGLTIIVTEGEMDYLRVATAYGDAADTAPAVIGVRAGSWSDALTRRIPPGTTVALMTHRDEAGDRYAAQIDRSIRRVAGHSVAICRWQR